MGGGSQFSSAAKGRLRFASSLNSITKLERLLLSYFALGLPKRAPAIENTPKQDLVAVKPLGQMIILVLFFAVLGRVLAKAGPKTPLNGSGSKNGAERTYN